MSKFKVGDRVQIVKYGHLVSHFDRIEGHSSVDMNPELIGQNGIVTKVSTIGKSYSLKGPRKTEWYQEDQLELSSGRTALERPDMTIIVVCTKRAKTRTAWIKSFPSVTVQGRTAEDCKDKLINIFKDFCGIYLDDLIQARCQIKIISK